MAPLYAYMSRTQWILSATFGRDLASLVHSFFTNPNNKVAEQLAKLGDFEQTCILADTSNEACIYAAEMNGYIEISDALIAQGINPGIGIAGACYRHDIARIDMFLARGNYANHGLYGAAKGGHVDIVRDMLARGADASDWGLWAGCLANNREIVDRMISLGAANWDRGLFSACRRGHLDMAKYMISCGATHFDQGLIFACKGGHLEMAKFMISCGATNFNLALYGACKGGHSPAIEFAIGQGARDWCVGVSGACSHMRQSIVTNMVARCIRDGHESDVCEYCDRPIISHISKKEADILLTNHRACIAAQSPSPTNAPLAPSPSVMSVLNGQSTNP